MTRVRWKPVHGVNTAAVVRWTRDCLEGCDPYLVWADASTRPPAADRPADIGVLVELNEGESVSDLVRRMDNEGGSPRFVPNQLGGTYPTLFVTGIVNRAGLCQLIEEVRQRKIQRFTLQGARADLSSMARNEFDKIPLARREVSTQTRSAGPAAQGVAGPAYLGILDDGLPFLRARQSIAVSGPQAHLWDQGWQREGMVVNPDNPGGGPPGPDDPYWRLADERTRLEWPGGVLWLPSEGFLYGRRTKRPPLSGARPLADRDEYLASRYVHPAPRQTHGASVLGLMAPWLSTRRTTEVEWPTGIAGLAMVQLPTPTVDDTSGGSLAMRVLDGIRYVLWQELKDRADSQEEAAAAERPARPTIVNVSYGLHGGPHDGSSMFERAASEALDANEHLHLVLPMGNAHRAGIHARHRLGPSGKGVDAATLKLRVPPDSPRDTFLEIWIPQGAAIEVEIVPPGDARSYPLRRGEALMAYEPEQAQPTTPRVVRFAGIYPARVADSTNCTMVLVAIGATRIRSPRPPNGPGPAFEPVGANQQRRRAVIAPSGEWRVRLRNVTDTELEVNAWIQRDDAAPDRASASRQAWFPDSVRPEVRTGQTAPEGTVNGVATFSHQHLHVIAAMRAGGRLSSYSAARPPGSAARPPQAVTVADWSPSLRGILSLGFLQGAVTRLDGTSAACGVYSRALARQLASDPNSLPQGCAPGFVEPEFDDGAEKQPAAPDDLRGQDVRTFLPFDVEIATRPPCWE